MGFDKLLDREYDNLCAKNGDGDMENLQDIFIW